MNDYMKALHQQFYREPDFTEMEDEIEHTRQEVRDCLDKMQRRTLMRLVDTQNLLREETSLASFIAGFKLAWGMTRELEAGGLYSFDEDETERACRQFEMEQKADPGEHSQNGGEKAMAQKRSTLWIDERWYRAISRHLKGETLEEHLEGILDQLCNQLPEREYDRISKEICLEREQNQ